MSNRTQQNRREFLQAVGGTAAATGLFSTSPMYRQNSNALGTNERVRVAIIGCGDRGTQLSQNLPNQCEVVAFADANRPKAEKLAAAVAPKAAIYDDYRPLLDRGDLDGVLICTPLQHHAHAGVLASAAGIDSYVEKPLSLDFAEGRSLVDAARRYDRVVQVGTQQRSMEMNQFACELVRDGGIGKVRVVEFVNYGTARPYPAEGLAEEPVPPGLNWDTWLGPAPMRPFSPRLSSHWSDGFANWWGHWREYSIGQIGGLGAHGFDMVQYALGMDDTGPVELWPAGEDETGVQRVDFRYAEGPEVRLSFADKKPMRGPRLGAVFSGSKCKIEINRNRFQTNPADFVKEGPDPALAAKWEGDGWIARGHIENWLDCIKTRQRPNADIEIGHRAATLGHLVNITRAMGRRLRWDPVQECFPDEPEANALLTMPKREGWELPS